MAYITGARGYWLTISRTISSVDLPITGMPFTSNSSSPSRRTSVLYMCVCVCEWVSEWMSDYISFKHTCFNHCWVCVCVCMCVYVCYVSKWMSEWLHHTWSSSQGFIQRGGLEFSPHRNLEIERTLLSSCYHPVFPLPQLKILYETLAAIWHRLNPHKECTPDVTHSLCLNEQSIGQG